MADSKYSTHVCKSSKSSITAIIKNQEKIRKIMLKFVPDYLKTKKICKHAIKKITSLNKIYS